MVTPASASASAPGPDPRYRFLARFGATILSGGIAAIPMALYHYQAELGLVPQEVWFVGYILAHRWTDALPYPSLRRMSRRTGVSAQMLHRYKQSLIEKGYLATISRHRPSGGRTSNYYDFSGLFQVLETRLSRDRRDASWSPSVDDGESFAEEEEAAALQHQPASVPAGQQQAMPLLDKTDPPLPAPTQRQLAGAKKRALSANPQPPLTEVAEPERSGPVAPKQPQNQSSLRKASSGDRFTGAMQPTTPDGVANDKTTTNPLSAQEQAEYLAYLALSQSSSSQPPDEEALEARWQHACANLTRTLSEASFNAWIAPLQLCSPEECPAGPPGVESLPPVRSARTSAGAAAPITLACASAFHLHQVERRYRAAIEQALGAPVHLVIRG